MVVIILVIGRVSIILGAFRNILLRLRLYRKNKPKIPNN